jgi:hypothetical protein
MVAPAAAAAAARSRWFTGCSGSSFGLQPGSDRGLYDAGSTYYWWNMGHCFGHVEPVGVERFRPVATSC